MTQAHTLSPQSWHPLPCGGRALVREHYVPHWDHVPERKSKKATLTSKTALVSVADAEARMRETGAPQLNARERKRYALDSFNPSQHADRDTLEVRRSSVLAGSAKGAALMRERAIANSLRMLAEHPERRTQHCRTMVSDEIVTREGQPFFRVVCATSGEALHPVGQWARGHGAGCRKCDATRRRQGAGRRKREEAIAAE